MKVRLIITLAAFIISCPLLAQDGSGPLDAAQALYDNSQFQEAIEAIDAFVTKDSLNPRAYKIRGNSYYDLKDLDKALADYLKAIEVDAAYHDGHYNAGNTYEVMEDFANAALYFQNYVNLQPEDTDGYFRLAYTKAMLGESVSELYQTAYNLDSQNVAAVYYLAMDYYAQNEYDKSMALIEKGKVMAPQEMAFVMGSGLNHMAMEAYQEAYEDFSFAVSIEPLNVNALAMKVSSSLLSSTSTSLWQMNEDRQVRFTPANGNTLAQWVDKAGPTYDLDQLSSQISEGQILTIDQYLYYYAKHKDHPGYSPYGIGLTSQISELMKEEKYAEVADLGKDIFTKGYVRLRDLDRIAQACYAEQRIEEFTLIYQHYEALMQSLLTLGDGLSAKEALFVMSTSDEYSILNYLEMGSSSQSLISEDGHSYDRLDAVNAAEEKTPYYFNIDIPFSSLSSSFGQDDSPEDEEAEADEKGKKKRKKKRKDKKKKKKEKSDG
ncbi:MAG: hypothetical protein Roseis2KO_02860 [Roseivirga sp.]